MALPFDDKIDVLYPFKFSHRLEHKDVQVIVCNQFDCIANALHHMGFYEEANQISSSCFGDKQFYTFDQTIESIFNDDQTLLFLKTHFTALEFKDDFDIISGIL